MNIELRKIQFSERMSQETSCFIADIYIDGKKVGSAENDGHGGCTNYHIADRTLLAKAEAYCKTLPDLVYDFGNIKMNLEHKIDELLNDWLKAKDNKRFNNKMQKDMLRGIILKTEKGYETLTWRGHTITSMLQHPQGKATIKQKVFELKKQGKEILNTNLTEFL